MIQDLATRTGWPIGDTRAGWAPDSFDREAVSWQLGDREIAALEKVRDLVLGSGVALGQLTNAQLAHPVLEEFFAPVSQALRWGQGLVFVQGIPVAGRDLDEVRIFYRTVGAYFGDPVSQNWKGETMVEVAAVGGAASGRAYASSGALPLHADRIDMLSLMVVRNAAQGGESIFGSSLHAWNVVERERPDILPILQRGFRQSRNGEQADGDPGVTPWRVPVFAEHDGLRSCLVSGNASPMMIRRNIDEPMSEAEAEALEWFKTMLDRPEMRITVQMEPGDAVFVNNYEVLHGRRSFEDQGGPDGRLLLRLWLQGVPPRPRPAEQIVTVNRSGRQGIDPRPGPPTA